MFIIDYFKALLISILIFILLLFFTPMSPKLYILIFIMLYFVSCVAINSIRRHDFNVMKKYVKDAVDDIKKDS